MKNVSEFFGCKVSMYRVRGEFVSQDLSEKRSIRGQTDISAANAVASAMKDGAVANELLIIPHWFQPLTGVTAEKHE